MIAATPKTSLSAEDVVDLQLPEQVHVSPAGDRVAYVVKAPGQATDHDVSTIWIAKVGKESSARQMTSGLHYDRHPTWAPDNSHRLAFLSDRHSKGKACAIYIIEREHLSEPLLVTSDHTQKPIDCLAWSPSGEYIAFASPDPKAGCDRDPGNDAHVHDVDWECNRLHLLHVSTRSVTTLYSGPSHVHSLAWKDDSQKIICALYQNPGLDATIESGAEFISIDISTKQLVEIGSFPAPIKSHIQYSDGLIFFAAARTLKYICSASGLYALSADNGSETFVFGGYESDVIDVHAVRSTRLVRVQQNLFEEIWTRRSTSSFKLLYGTAQEISSWHAVEDAATGRAFIALVQSNAGSPPEVYSLSMEDTLTKPDHVPVRLSSHGKHLMSRRLARGHELLRRSYDGRVTVRGMMFVPEGYRRADGPLPALALIHGGPYARVADAFMPGVFAHQWALYLLSTGRWAVVCPNYRGSSGMGDDFALAAHGKMGTVDYDDTLAVVDEAIARGVVDAARVVVGGWSHGGSLAYLSAVRNGYTEEAGALAWAYRGAVCGAGVTDWDMVNMTSRSARFGAELVGSAPWDRSRHDVRARECSAVWELRSTEASVPPVLQLHGERDVDIPVSQAVAFHRVATAKGLDCQLVTYPREGHRVRERAHQIDMLKRVLRFCDRVTAQAPLSPSRSKPGFPG